MLYFHNNNKNALLVLILFPKPINILHDIIGISSSIIVTRISLTGHCQFSKISGKFFLLKIVIFNTTSFQHIDDFSDEI